MSTPGVLPEAQSTTAARLIAAAGELLLGRGAKGFTVADITTRAHVGKGTFYLYWPTKEDLLIGLVGRGFLHLLDDLIGKLLDEPGLAKPSSFCPAMLHIATSQPLVAALQRRDVDLLGVLADHPRSVALHDALGPGAVLRAVLPIWRGHGMARTDWDLVEQTFALHALITGTALSLIGPASGPVQPDDPLAVLSAAVTALLGPGEADDARLRSAAGEIVEFLRSGQAAALRLIDPPKHGG